MVWDEKGFLFLGVQANTKILLCYMGIRIEMMVERARLIAWIYALS